MIPELKAKELIEKFMPHTDCAGDAASYSEAKEIQKMQAKACAIICVGEIINQYQKMNDRQSNIVFEYKPTTVVDLLSYWQSVKQIIQQQ